MKKQLLLLLFMFGWSVYDLEASVTYQQIITAIGQKNGDQCETLAALALLQPNRYCIFQGLLENGPDLTVPLSFLNCVLFTNNVSVCTNNYSVFCDTCCSYSNTPGNKITARAIDLFLLESILFQAYEITKLLLTAYPYATVNIPNITNNWTLLMYASQLDDLPAAKLLLSYGADITACSNTGLSVIELAELNSSQNMINLLIYTDRMNVMNGTMKPAVVA
jgi:ankyrin repeat protein